jgi:threonine dehydrogenase-like Zn-dependent dehydrogenase
MRSTLFRLLATPPINVKVHIVTVDMKAAVYRGPHDISIEDRPVPSLEGPDDVIVRVRRAAICGTDASEWDHGPMLAKPPVTLGHEFTGEIVGSSRHGYDTTGGPGIRVVTGAGVWCGAVRRWYATPGRPTSAPHIETLGPTTGTAGLAEVCVRVPA